MAFCTTLLHSPATMMLLLTILAVLALMNSYGIFTKSSASTLQYYGFATSDHQIEGRCDRFGTNIWDVIEQQGKIVGNETAVHACKSYQYWRDDVQLLIDANANVYRFSIAWSRLIPDIMTGDIDSDGTAYYNSLIDELVKHNITPIVTLYHWSLPIQLSELIEMHNLTYTQLADGFLSDRIVKYFVQYADACFSLFGDRVKHWTTFNEPRSICSGYSGEGAPLRCSDRSKCVAGNSSIEVYICGHNLLKAHAEVYRLYKRHYAAKQNGQISIVVDSAGAFPLTESVTDLEATQRFWEFSAGWWLDPVVFGDYPKVMKELVGERLPKFSSREKRRLRKSFDFLGLNYYTSRFVANSDSKIEIPGWPQDSLTITSTFDVHNLPIGPMGASEWLWVYPAGLTKYILWVTNRYGRPPIFVTENGFDSVGETVNTTVDEAVADSTRVEYFKTHLAAVNSAIHGGADVRGYIAWSLIDNFEWMVGYTVRFGTHYVDFADPHRKRTPKQSAKWLTEYYGRRYSVLA